uniref:Uncharacterized protein n=1 Tax=Anguilla anguilla TaxID=7936 RepID=A0A0E9VRG3_ANGAN
MMCVYYNCYTLSYGCVTSAVCVLGICVCC